MKLWLKQTLAFFLILFLSSGLLTGAYFLTKKPPLFSTPGLSRAVLEQAYDSETYIRQVIKGRTLTKEEEAIKATVTHAYKTDDGAILVHIKITGMIEGETDKIIIAVKDGEPVHFVLLKTENTEYASEFGIITGERFTEYFTAVVDAVNDTSVKTALIAAVKLAQNLTEDLLNSPTFTTAGLSKAILKLANDGDVFTRLWISDLVIEKNVNWTESKGPQSAKITATHAYQAQNGSVIVQMKMVSTSGVSYLDDLIMVTIQDGAFINFVYRETKGSGGSYFNRLGITVGERFTGDYLFSSGTPATSNATSTKNAIWGAVALATEIAEAFEV